LKEKRKKRAEAGSKVVGKADFKNGKLQSPKKTHTKWAPPVNELTAKTLELLKTNGFEHKYDGYEFLIKQGNHTVCWINSRKYGTAMTLFPPYNEKWETVKIINEKEAGEAVDTLKTKVDNYRSRKKGE
jgi:hypothetical protein